MVSTENEGCEAPAAAESVELQEQGRAACQAEPSSGMPRDEDNPPENAVHAKETWKNNVWKISATFYSFVVVGGNDAVYGAIIPYLETHYSISHLVVSLVFLSPMVGYILAASVTNRTHERFGRRGVAFLGPASHVAAYIIICMHPPYPVLVFAFIFAGFGNGVVDAAWNAWIGNMANANEVLGFLHGFFGVGATLAPLIATTMITKAGLGWYHFYQYVMIPAAALELITSLAAFWREDKESFRANNPKPENRKAGVMREALSNRVTWVCAMFLLLYAGIEVGLGGWIVTFMMRVREGGNFESGMTSTGFWLGITVGRVVLGFVTPRLGENLAIMLYLAASMGMELLFWLVPSFVVSAVAVAMLGFFLGPLFPSVVVAATKLLPTHLHIGAIGFSAAIGGSGACILPFAVGALAQAVGVAVLQPCILGLLAASLLLWVIGVPNVSGKPRGGKARKMLQEVGSRLRRLSI